MYSKFELQLVQNSIAFKKEESMKNHTSFKIGGNAKYFITPASENECAGAISLCNHFNIPFHIIGKGTNLLINDNGIDGAVICVSNLMSEIQLLPDGKISCGAGALLSSVCNFALENSMTGMEFAFGIPGNIGGAVAMNAGAYGGEMKDIVVSCEYIDDIGQIHSINANELDFSYRKSFFSNKNFCITSVTLNLSKGDREQIKAQMDDILSRRKEKQPLEFPSAGSTFKRPEGSYASLLIDQCNLKGKTVGGAKVSEKHAGFVINFDNATCADVLELMAEIKDVVFKQTGFSLEPEVKIL